MGARYINFLILLCEPPQQIQSNVENIAFVNFSFLPRILFLNFKVSNNIIKI